MNRRRSDGNGDAPIQLTAKSLGIIIVTIILGLGGGELVRNYVREPVSTAAPAQSQQPTPTQFEAEVQRRLGIVESEIKALQQSAARIEQKIDSRRR